MRGADEALQAVRTEGSRITLADGRVLIDGIASWWTACHGYNHPHIRQAVTAQLEAMPHVMFGGLTHAPAERLAARLAALLPGDLDHVFFSDSGSVSVEVAIKIAVQYWINRGVPGRTRLLSFAGGYHGDTLATMAICDPEEGMHALFRGVLPEQVIATLPPGGDFEAMLARHAGELAAVIVEPLVQGAGGMRLHGQETLRAIRAACDRLGVLMIADEVFTGFGRTGSMFACEQAGVVPDIVCLSKALTGGTMGLAATVARPRVFEAFLSHDPAKALMHGPTFMANPLACAAANASLDLFEREDRLGQVAAIEAALRDGLAACRGATNVADVRVLGAIGVVEMAVMPPLGALKRAFVERGLFVRPFRNIVYLTPSFTIDPDSLGRLIDGVAAVVRAFSARAAMETRTARRSA
jgi:adenosylmethionine-8-amino-7-oxononanoate aminotransferase